MRAAVCRQFNAPLVIEEVTLAPPGHGEVEVTLAACAICHSDISFASGAWGGALPAVFGHEAAGRISAVGAGVQGLSTGMPVAVTLIRSCGNCPTCARAEPTSCAAHFPLDDTSPILLHDGQRAVHGMRTGAFAERVVLDASQVVPVPATMPLDLAALLGCGVITGYGAVTRSVQVPSGARVAVIGCGGVGINTLQGAALRDPACLIAVDVLPEKFALAEQFGATHSVDAQASDAAAQVKRAAGGGGVDFAFVAAGHPSAIHLGLEVLARGGTMVLLGMPAADVRVPFDPCSLASMGQRIVGSKMGSSDPRRDIPDLIALYADKRLKLDELVSGRFAFDEINDAMA
ncbi:MAG: alcohol dehydrogenase catalytic domain-containing protein, partial [Pseudomonadota bacterium]